MRPGVRPLMRSVTHPANIINTGNINRAAPDRVGTTTGSAAACTSPSAEISALLNVIMAPQPVVSPKFVLLDTPPIPGDTQVSAVKLGETERAAPVSREDSSENDGLAAVCASAHAATPQNATINAARMPVAQSANIAA